MSIYDFRFHRNDPAIHHEGQVDASNDHEAYQMALREIAHPYGPEAINGKDGEDYTLTVSTWRRC